MTRPEPLRRICLACRSDRGDSGFSLVEVLATMALMGVCIAVFMTAVNTVVVDVVKQTNTTDAAAGNSAGYLLFDEHSRTFTTAAGTTATEQLALRAADEIERPTDGSGADPVPVAKADRGGYYEYVEWHTTSSSVVQSCVQVRYDSENQVIQWRESTADASTTTTSYHLSPWTTVATGVVNDIADYRTPSAFQPPFSTPPTASSGAASVQAAQTLAVSFVTSRGAHLSGRETTSAIFAANNSNTANSPVTDQCLDPATFALDHATS